DSVGRAAAGRRRQKEASVDLVFTRRIAGDLQDEISWGQLPAEEVFYFVEHPASVRRRFARQLGEALQQRALLVGQGGRDADTHVHIVIAAAGTLQELHALAAQAEDLIRLRSRRDAQRLRSIDRVGGDLRSEG